ncbi:MAG: hypothetical protein R3190_11835, partial [Thermoanaerobaculia bacterium]|nr:hypothetical protein [Thermoanaerobaculia bacterium]
MESEPTTLEPVPDPPATEERHLRLAAAVLAAVATAVVALLLAFPDLRTSAPGDLAGGDRASTAKSEPAVEAPAALLNRITAQLLAAWRGGRFDADLFAELADVLDTEGHHLAGTAELHLLREWAAGGSSLAA